MSDPQSDSGGFQVSTTPTDEQRRYPVDNLIAVVDTRAQLYKTARELTESGFLASEIGALTGPAAADAIDASTGRAGIAGALIRLAQWTGLTNEEIEIKDLYEQALREHQFVIGVRAPTVERKGIAERILAANHARFIHYFSRFSIQRVRP